MTGPLGLIMSSDLVLPCRMIGISGMRCDGPVMTEAEGVIYGITGTSK